MSSRRHCFSSASSIVSLQVLLFLATAVLATVNHCSFAITKNSRLLYCHDSSLPSVPRRSCAASCHYLGNFITGTRIKGNDGFSRSVLRSGSKKRLVLRRNDASHSHWRLVPRGGGGTQEETHPATEQQQSMEHSPSSHQQQRMVLAPSSLPLIDTKSISLTLRLTCETNRRLRHGTSLVGDGNDTFKSSRNSLAASANIAALQPHPTQQLPHPSQQHMMTQSSTIPPAIRSISEQELSEERLREELTVFHSTEPWEGATEAGRDGNATAADGQARDEHNAVETSRASRTSATTSRTTGISRWGPNLQSYLDALLSSISLDGENATDSHRQLSPMDDESQLILALTLLYLDRSTSFDAKPLHVDPHTGRPWLPPCPYLVPRTVHRMALTAFVVAVKCVRGYVDNETDYSTVLREAANSMLGEGKCSISNVELEQMEGWMVHALDGGGGPHAPHHPQHHPRANHWQISQEEIGAFLRKWGAAFYPSRLAAHDRSRMKQLESFWRQQTSGFFGSRQHPAHGHGNAHWPDGSVDHHSPSLQHVVHDGQWQHPEQQRHSHDHDVPPQEQYHEAMGSEPF